MKRIWVLALMVGVAGCHESQERVDQEAVSAQQALYAKAQPIPVFEWSLERHLTAQLYDVRNRRAATHSVWRGDTGAVEGDCPSLGYGLPYDTSLTNPLQITHTRVGIGVIEQAEPNGIFASKNTQATWVLCTGPGGTVEPVYVETKVTSYPYPVAVDYSTNRVTRAGKSTVSLRIEKH